MILRYQALSQCPSVFKAVVGMTVAEFNGLAAGMGPRLEEADRARAERADRKRAPGGGHPFNLSPRDQVLMTVVRLHNGLTHEVVGYLFGVSKATASRTVARVQPLLESAEARPARPGPGLGGLGSRGPRGPRFLDGCGSPAAAGVDRVDDEGPELLHMNPTWPRAGRR